MRTIKRVSVESAIKVGATLSALGYAIFGLIGLLCQGLIFSGLSALTSTSRSGSNFNSPNLAVFGGGLIGSIAIYVIFVVLAAIGGAIAGAMYALLYNWTVGMTGGLQVEVE